MRKIGLYIGLALTVCLFCQCSDYLDVSNSGHSDDDFVMSSPEEAFKTLSWAYARYRQDVVHGGNYQFNDVCGSDAEVYPENNSANNMNARLRPEMVPSANDKQTQYDALCYTLARAARIADVIESKGVLVPDRVDDWSQIYGEAKTLWALSYWQLVLHFGDVPFGNENKYVTEYALTSRFEIIDNILAELKRVEGMMRVLHKTEGLNTPERLSRTFANALIGEIALHAGGWQTIRTDVAGLYGDVQFEKKGVEANGCVYARRTDWMDYIKVAEKYLNDALTAQIGDRKLITADDRSYANNPFQRHFQYINDRESSIESLFEIGTVPNQGNCEHPYSMGRPAANSGNAPYQTFNCIRIIPTFFYSAYEEGDKRRDASMVVTGGNGGNEVLVPLKAGNRVGGGGPSINKWDFNKAEKANEWQAKSGNRSSGMNYCVMRISDAMLMLAEAKAYTGDNAGAVSLVNQIRERAFGEPRPIGNLSGEALLDAIWAERKLELLGEGDIRWDMIRSGKFVERALAVRQEVKDMIAGLEGPNKSYTFNQGQPNERTISLYVYTKPGQINGKTVVTYDAVDDSDPFLFPGWRGIYDWNTVAGTTVSGEVHNLGIRGLYERIDIAEETTLIADGWSKVAWGQDILENQGTSTLYDDNIMGGIETVPNGAPRYYHPIPSIVISQSKGQVTNGYGLPQE